MTFDDICALDREALELAIERWCYPEHTWLPAAQPADWWVLTSPARAPVLVSSVPHLHHTASWDTAMALAWAWQIGVFPLDGARWAVQCFGVWITVSACTEDEARLQIGRLAVWRAMQQGKEEEHA